MSDLVKRLRYEQEGAEFSNRYAALVGEAADIIEQLEADLASAAKADPMTATEILLGRQIEQLERELRVYMDAAEGHMVERLRAIDELAAEKALADSLAEILKNCDVSTGYCCCGDSVDHHGMGSGHSPVDEVAYHSEKALETYRKARGL